MSFAENCREGCNMKAGVSQVQSLEKLSHNPGKKQLISILNQNYTGRKLSNCTDFKQKTKFKKKHTALKEKKTIANGNTLMSKRSFRGLLSALLPVAGPVCWGIRWVLT